MADAGDLKSPAHYGCVGSNPTSATACITHISCGLQDKQWLREQSSDSSVLVLVKRQDVAELETNNGEKKY